MSDRWTDRLSEYLDGELAVADRAALEAHLASCGDCRATLEELRRVVARARALDDRTPAADLWPEVAARIGLSPAAGRIRALAWGRARRLSFTVPQLLAASVALMLVSGGGAWVVLRRPTVSPATATTGPTPIMTNVGTYESSPRYATAVADLERLVAERRSQLDTTTVRVIEKNLGIIDRAIRDAQSALAADPANAYLNQHLAQAMRRKLELLRQAATLAGARS